MDKQDDTRKTACDTCGEAVSETALEYNAAPKLPFEEGRRYTYSDYRTWGDDVRYELIDGIPMVMDAPNRRHQKISRELVGQFYIFLKDKPCEVYAAPFDVRMNPDGADDTVVQPDIVIICDRTKLTDAGCDGAPDMVIEISSPSTSQRDRLVKLLLYEKTGVREYWVVEPDTCMVTVYILDNGRYFIKAYGDTDTIPVNVLDGCKINLAEVFAEK